MAASFPIQRRAHALSVHSGDFDGDQIADLAFVTESGSEYFVWVAESDGYGSSRHVQRLGETGRVGLVHDLTGDGKSEIVLLHYEERAISILTGITTDGALSFRSRRVDMPAAPTSAAAGDLNRDGQVDLVIGHYGADHVSVLSGAARTGPGRGPAPEGVEDLGALYTGPNPVTVALADVDGDKHLDLLFGGNASLWMVASPGGPMPGVPRFLVEGDFERFQVADFNGDRYPDLLARKGQLALVFAGTGSGFSETFASRQPEYLPTAVDLNGDGRLDLFTWERFHRMFAVQYGHGDGTFGIVERIRAPGWTMVLGDNLAVADLNRDGALDLALPHFTPQQEGRDSNASLVVLMNRPEVFIETPNEGQSAGIGSDLRIAWRHRLAPNSHFRVEVSRDSERTWTTIAPHVASRGRNGYLVWRVTGPVTLTARFRVTSADDSRATDVNNANIAVDQPTLRFGGVRSGESMAIGSTRRLSWSHNLGVGKLVDLDVSRDNGQTWHRIAAQVPLRGTRTSSMRWKVAGPPTAAARFRVSSTDDPGVSHVSDVFSIAPPTLEILAPRHDQWFLDCEAVPVVWTHNMGTLEQFHMDFSDNDGGTWTTVADGFLSSAAARGRYRWISSGRTPTTRGLIRVVWSSSPSTSAVTGPLTFAFDPMRCDDDQ